MREISQGKVIYSIGQKVDSFYLIRKGTVTVAYPGGRYLLQSGDVIGLCEMGSGISAMEYRAGTDLEVLVYPFGAAQMKRILRAAAMQSGIFRLPFSGSLIRFLPVIRQPGTEA